jgi:hypothetical protein
MKLLNKIFVIYLLLLSFAYCVDVPAYVSIGGYQESAGYFITKASQTPITGVVIYGGLATNTDTTWTGKIVLLDRGTNTFTQKLNNVKNSGGIGAIVANNVSGDYVASLGTSSSTLTSITISREYGDKLKLKLGSTITITSIVPPLPTNNPPIISTTIKIGVLKTSVVNLIATGQGSAPFTWQWRLEGVNLIGKITDTLTLYDSSLVSGNYTISATNSAGTATSPAYNLIVSP